MVDDDANIRELLRLYVQREGHRTLFAADGEAALELAVRTKPDVVLLDVMLPGMNGLEVCRRLRDVSDVPILLLTAESAEGDRSSAWTWGRTTTSSTVLAARAHGAGPGAAAPATPGHRGDR